MMKDAMWRVWCRAGAQWVYAEQLHSERSEVSMIPLGSLVDESRWLVEPRWTAQAIADLLQRDGSAKPQVAESTFTYGPDDRVMVCVIVSLEPGQP
jgi:hypothetical protein